MARTQKNLKKKLNKNPVLFQRRILDWYDRHRRVLPWRAPAGKTAEPYHVWLSEIMLQQTTVGAVIPYFIKFLEKWPKIEDLAAADQDEVMHEWAGLGYYARARNLHACAKVIAGQGGIFPQDQKSLRALPGIGDYTSNAIAAIAFDQPANVVDGNVERVMARYFRVEEPLPKSKPLLKDLAAGLAEDLVVTDRSGDYAQALMDLGATICTPKSPKCMLCPVSEDCQAALAGMAEDLPRKEKKADKPQKRGHVYWVESGEGEVLLHRRPEKGMLGGMAGLPTSEWGLKGEERAHLEFLTPKSQLSETVRHSFTHFDLELELHQAKPDKTKQIPDGYFWAGSDDLKNTGFPTLFKKAYRLFVSKR